MLKAGCVLRVFSEMTYSINDCCGTIVKVKRCHKAVHLEPLQTNNTAPTGTLSLAFNGFTIINGVASANPNLQNAVVSANNVVVNVGGGTPTIVPSLTGLLQVGPLMPDHGMRLTICQRTTGCQRCRSLRPLVFVLHDIFTYTPRLETRLGCVNQSSNSEVTPPSPTLTGAGPWVLLHHARQLGQHDRDGDRLSQRVTEVRGQRHPQPQHRDAALPGVPAAAGLHRRGHGEKPSSTYDDRSIMLASGCCSLETTHCYTVALLHA